MAYVYLLIAFSLNAVANILLKLGSQKGLITNVPFQSLILTNWQFVLGVMLFAVNVFFYFLALRALPISVAYPIMVVMSFILINVYALLFLSEGLSLVQLAGYVLIVAGLVLVVGFAR